MLSLTKLDQFSAGDVLTAHTTKLHFTPHRLVLINLIHPPLIWTIILCCDMQGTSIDVGWFINTTYKNMFQQDSPIFFKVTWL